MTIQNTLAWVPRLNLTPQQVSTPTISTSAYTSGFQIGGIMKIDNMVRQNSNNNGDATGFGSAEIHSLKIADNSTNNAPIDLWFFGLSPTLTNAGDHTAFSITKAHQLSALYQGAINIGTTWSNSAVACGSTDGANVSLNILIPSSSTTPNSFYVVAIIRAGATYTSTTSLSFIYNSYSD